MNSWLLVILSLSCIFAIYWAVIGQWKYNRMMRQSENETAKEKKD